MIEPAGAGNVTFRWKGFLLDASFKASNADHNYLIVPMPIFPEGQGLLTRSKGLAMALEEMVNNERRGRGDGKTRRTGETVQIISRIEKRLCSSVLLVDMS